jgi:hypothetical protein
MKFKHVGECLKAFRPNDTSVEKLNACLSYLINSNFIYISLKSQNDYIHDAVNEFIYLNKSYLQLINQG